MRKHSLGNRAALIFAFVFLFSHACLARERISDAEKTPVRFREWRTSGKKVAALEMG